MGSGSDGMEFILALWLCDLGQVKLLEPLCPHVKIGTLPVLNAMAGTQIAPLQHRGIRPQLLGRYTADGSQLLRDGLAQGHTRSWGHLTSANQ